MSGKHVLNDLLNAHRHALDGSGNIEKLFQVSLEAWFLYTAEWSTLTNHLLNSSHEIGCIISNLHLTLHLTTWRRVSLTLKQLRKEAAQSFVEMVNRSWSSLCWFCAPCFRVLILCTEQHSTPNGLHLFDKRQVRHVWGQEKPNCIHLARFIRFLLSFFPTGPQTNHMTSISIYLRTIYLDVTKSFSIIMSHILPQLALSVWPFFPLEPWNAPREFANQLPFSFHRFHAFALLLFFAGPLFFSVNVFLGWAGCLFWRTQKENEQQGEREWRRCK